MQSRKQSGKKRQQGLKVRTFGPSTRRATIAKTGMALVALLAAGILLGIIPVREGASPASAIMMLGSALTAGSSFMSHFVCLSDEWISLIKYRKEKQIAFVDIDLLELHDNSAIVRAGSKKITIDWGVAEHRLIIRELIERLEALGTSSIVGDRTGYMSKIRAPTPLPEGGA